MNLHVSYLSTFKTFHISFYVIKTSVRVLNLLRMILLLDLINILLIFLDSFIYYIRKTTRRWEEEVGQVCIFHADAFHLSRASILKLEHSLEV